MQTWQILPILMLIGVGALIFVTRGKMIAMATQGYAVGFANLRQQFEASRQPGEQEPACFLAITRSMLKGRMFFVGMTDRRVHVRLSDGETHT